MSTITTTLKPKPSGFGLALAKHPIIAYFVIAFLGAWLLNLPIVLGKDGLGVFTYSVPLPVYAVLFILGAYGPTLAAFLVTAALDGRQGTRALFRRYGQWRFGVQWYLFALFAFPIINLAAACFWMGLEPLRMVLSKWPAYFTQYLPALLIFPALITWGEEPGWRGFALTRLQARYDAKRYGPLLATGVVGLFHGIWHLPIFLLVNGPVAAGPFSLGRFAENIAAIVIISIIWTWVFNNAGGSILMAVLLHASFNAAEAYISSVVTPFPQQAGYVSLGIFLVMALILVVVTRGRLGYRPT